MTIGRTLRLTDTRGVRSQPASAHAWRNHRICSAWSSSKGTPVSSTSSVELMRFIPCSAAHTAVWRVPDPHQIRSGKPGDWGWIGSIPATPVMRTSAGTTPAPAIAARNRRVCARAMSASVLPSEGT